MDAPDDRVLLDHGSGGKLMHRLLADRVGPRLGLREALELDAAPAGIGGVDVAFTTDSFVVQPPVFPGGSIGTLAVYGTVNDLAVAGAEPVALTCGLILEEGLPFDLLDRVLDDVARCAQMAGVEVVAGDTKVVERGAADGLFVNTAGVGRYAVDPRPHPSRIAPGDAILVSGPIGEHGIAVMLARSDADIEADVRSDCASVWPLVRAALDSGANVHTLRDPTRGGVATTLNEWARGRAWGIAVDEADVPVRAAVANTCELLGLDPLYVACEGRVVLACPEADADRVLAAWGGVDIGVEAAVIGRVTADEPGRVTLTTRIGGRRRLDMLAGAQLPRIC